jgi:hypothetical protein
VSISIHLNTLGLILFKIVQQIQDDSDIIMESETVSTKDPVSLAKGNLFVIYWFSIDLSWPLHV